MKITTEMILSKNPCSEWTEKRIASFIGKGKTLLQIAKLKGIPIEDIVWCVTKFLPDKLNRKFAFWCAEQCKPTLPEITNYIKIAKKFYAGKATQEELAAASSAAYSAADWAADWAAYSAADSAAYSAADRAAYWAADWAVDWAAYSAADWAAKLAMQRKQLAKLIAIIGEAE